MPKHFSTKKEAKKLLIIQAFTAENRRSYNLDEAIGLAETLDFNIHEARKIQVRSVTAATFIGSGHVEIIIEQITEHKIDAVFIDANLSAIQLRNLQRKFKVAALDRTSIILQIFAMRAQTREGHLQVRLAQLEHQRTQLVRAWTHLERQRGGFGFAAGPGEKQMELDRRMLEQTIASIKSDLNHVKQTRNLQRKNRIRTNTLTIALVGYTNAGKSCLFNKITKAEILSEDKLFATLDPTVRSFNFKSGQSAVMSDTVGFISNLPTLLVAAFRATLEEIIHADIILHVMDIHNLQAEQQKEEVLKVLESIGVEMRPGFEGSIPVIEVWNKVDLCDDQQRSFLYEKSIRRPYPVHLMSAFNKGDCVDLLGKIETELQKLHQKVRVRIPSDRGDLIAWCYRNGAVSERIDNETYITMNISMDKEYLRQLRRRIPNRHINYVAA